MSTLAIFRSIQIGFLILMMVAIGYCNRIREVQTESKTAQRTIYFQPDSTVQQKVPR